MTVLSRSTARAEADRIPVEASRDVLTWIMLGLAAWLGIGVLTARLFGALAGGSQRWWEQDEDDQDFAKGGSA